MAQSFLNIIIKLLILIILLPIWLPLLIFFEVVLRPFLMLFTQIIDSCSNGVRLLAVLAVTVLFFWVVQIAYLLWAFVQIPKNVIKYMEITDIGKALGNLLWEDDNKVENFFNGWLSGINSQASRDEYVSIA